MPKPENNGQEKPLGHCRILFDHSSAFSLLTSHNSIRDSLNVVSNRPYTRCPPLKFLTINKESELGAFNKWVGDSSKT